ncbi:MAG TPA: TolC family protein [Terriglobales bacterium]|nr:TolC family protein [Terriglobales bacterium]
MIGLLLLAAGSAAQERSPYWPGANSPILPAPAGLPLKVAFPGLPANHAAPPAGVPGAQTYRGASSSTSKPGDAPAGVRRITLDEAQQQAAAAANPMVRLAELQVEAAKQHRLGFQSLYFPNISGQLVNLHINKQTGEVLTVRRPFGLPPAQVPVNIFAKDSTMLNFTAAQPITPLFSIHELVKIARADENIARAKAGMPVAETARQIEKNYFDLLVAQRELAGAQADASKVRGKWLRADASGAPPVSPEQEIDMLAAEKEVLLATSKVQELTASLNEMLGLPEGTILELVPPEPLVEDVSLKEANEKAAANPEVVEAEQTAVKAHAGSALAKLQYLPTVAVLGGYANQNFVSNALLPRDFSYIGIMATYTIFDFGKRERDVKERAAQVEAADLAVQLTKAKVAGEVKKSYFELERSRQLSQLARRMMSASRVMDASYRPDDPEMQSARAKMEAEMYRAELEHRQAFGRLKSLMGDK